LARFLGTSSFSHSAPVRTGILLTNLGTPQAPTPAALRRFLGEFLSDHRVVELPRFLWLAILHGVILRIRPKESAKNYASIWGQNGSPLLTISKQQHNAFEKLIQEALSQHQQESNAEVHVALGMRYGNPSIPDALEQLRQAQCENLIVLPLYPQYAGATTGSTFDAVANTLKKWRWVPQLHFVNHYHDHPDFINACVEQIQDYWTAHGSTEKLILSYHGVPEKQLLQGDPYHCQCHKTTRLIAQQLGIAPENILTTFQSRFGKAKWLEPYTDATLTSLAQTGTQSISVFCPGFSADCLETLEEIAVENKNYFLENGGQRFEYIPCLNDNKSHIQALASKIMPILKLWQQQDHRNGQTCLKLAKQLGAKG